MPQYAAFDPTQPEPQPVKGWYDTDFITYPDLPDASGLLELTSEQWDVRTTGHWAVQGGSLVVYTPPLVPVSPYEGFIAGGLTVTSTTTPAIAGIYAIDPDSQVDIATEAQFISTFGEFTAGGEKDLPWLMPDKSVVTFPTLASFLAFAKIAARTIAAAKMAAATGAAMPSSTVTV